MLGSSARLGDLTKIRTGKLDANASSEDGEYPFFTCARYPLRISSYSYDCECVLVAGNGDLNVKYYEGKFDAYQRTYIVEALKESKHDLHLRYVYHFLEAYLETLREQSIGGIIKYIKLGNLTDAIIPLPPLDVQKRIAAILDAADELRAKRRASLALLDDLLQSTFLDMLGDPVTNPMGWEICRLGNVTSIGSGAGFPNQYQGRETGQYPFYKVSDMNLPGNERYLRSCNNFIDEDVRASLGAKVHPAGTVVFPKIGAAIATNKKRMLTSPSCFDNNVIGIHPSGSFTVEWLFGLIQTKQLMDFANPGNPPSIRKTVVEDWQIPTPPLDLQQRFAAIVESVEQQKARYQAHLDELDTLFASLQSRAFKGEL